MQNKKRGVASLAPAKNPRGKKKRELVVFTDQDSGAEDGGPEAALVADGGLRDVHSANDFVGDPVDLFFLIEA